MLWLVCGQTSRDLRKNGSNVAYLKDFLLCPRGRTPPSNLAREPSRTDACPRCLQDDSSVRSNQASARISHPRLHRERAACFPRCDRGHPWSESPRDEKLEHVAEYTLPSLEIPRSTRTLHTKWCRTSTMATTTDWPDFLRIGNSGLPPSPKCTSLSRRATDGTGWNERHGVQSSCDTAAWRLGRPSSPWSTQRKQEPWNGPYGSYCRS